MSAITEDRFLNGRIVVRQPATGFRSGLDAVMLAAAVPAGDESSVLELGTGAGAASLCLAARVASIKISGVEIDAGLADLANANARDNGFEARLHVAAADVFSLPKELRRDFAHVFSNPPFHASEGMKPPATERTRALHDEGRLSDWLEAGVRRTISGGTFTAIIRADRLLQALSALPQTGVTLFPLWPRRDEPAKRVLLQLIKGSGRPFEIMPGLVLHETDGRYTADAEAVLRDGASLALGKPRL